MLQEFGAINDGVNPLSNIEVTAWLYELYGYVTPKLKSWCLYIKYAEALNNPVAKLLGEYRGVPCAAKNCRACKQCIGMQRHVICCVFLWKSFTVAASL